MSEKSVLDKTIPWTAVMLRLSGRLNSPDVQTEIKEWGFFFQSSVIFFVLIRYVCRWGYITHWTPEWSCSRHSEVHHHSQTSRETIPLSKLEIQWGEHHQFHQHQHHWSWICRQDLIRPSHGVPGAQKPGTGGQRGVHYHHHTRCRAAKTGEDQSDCVWWVSLYTFV